MSQKDEIKYLKRQQPKMLPNYTLKDVTDALCYYDFQHKEFFHNNEGIQGVTNFTDKKIYINNGLKDLDNLRRTVVHELGHAIYPHQKEKKIVHLDYKMMKELYGDKFHGVPYKHLQDHSRSS